VYTGWVRTNIDIDDELLARAQAVAGTRGKKATVEFALRELVRRKERQKVLELRGKVAWEGDLDQSRAARQSSSTPPCGSTSSATPARGRSNTSPS
jgi:Arc/MetJ family transcription regulator